jgi:hypothetical protein
MANEFVAKNGLISQNNTIVTGSLTTTGLQVAKAGTSGFAHRTTDYIAGTTGTSLFTSLGTATGNTYGIISVRTSGGSSAAADLILNSNGSGRIAIGTSKTSANATLDVFGNAIITGSLTVSTTSDIPLLIKGGTGTLLSVSSSTSEIFKISDTFSPNLFTVSTGSIAVFNIDNTNSVTISGSLIVTGSTTIIGTQTIAGSLIVTGSTFITGPVDLVSYTTTNSFTGSAIASLAIDSQGNVLTSGFTNPLKAYQAAGSNIKAMPVGLWAFNFTPAVAAQTNQTLRLNAVYLPTNETITGVRWYQAVLQVGATPSNYNGFGLYTLSGTTLTCQVSSSNSSTIWSGGSINSYNSIAFDAPYAATAGLYYIAFLYSVSVGGTAPTFGVSVTTTAANQLIPGLTTNNKLTATILTQTSMPTSIAMSTATAATTVMNVSLY